MIYQGRPRYQKRY